MCLKFKKQKPQKNITDIGLVFYFLTLNIFYFFY